MGEAQDSLGSSADVSQCVNDDLADYAGTLEEPLRNLRLQEDQHVPVPSTEPPVQADERAELEMYRRMLGGLHVPSSLGEPTNVPSGPTSVS